MVDFADRASKQEERDRAAAIEQAGATYRITKSACFWCANCGERIPEPRRKAVPGTPWCVACAVKPTPSKAKRQHRDRANKNRSSSEAVAQTKREKK